MMAENALLTSADQEPPIGATVVTEWGQRWTHSPEAYWLADDTDGDPESWTKVAGNYGPVRVVP